MWLKVGTSRNRKYIPVHDIFNNLPDGYHTSLPSFHALTGSDSTSFIAYHSKQTTFELFLKHHGLLDGIGKNANPPSQDVLNCAEKFVCHIYKVPHATSVDNARALLFGHCKKTEALPPTSDALNLHLMRVHYLSLIWNLAHIPKPNIPDPTCMGWKVQDKQLVPLLMTKAAIPEACLSLVACQCKTGCRNCQCGCRKAGYQCTINCHSGNGSSLCHNNDN